MTKVIKNVHNYVLEGPHKILMRITKINLNDSQPTTRRVVLSSWRQLILSQYHDFPWAGTHLRYDKTYKNKIYVLF